tara:strand:+ start:779 stop:1057 length:279 start_codon:yes stop_codon:yes gene_type:complete
MNTDELIVMGVLMILAGGLMVARHFVHTAEIPAPMATRKARKATGDATNPATVQYANTVPLLAEALKVQGKTLKALRERLEALERRIAKLED